MKVKIGSPMSYITYIEPHVNSFLILLLGKLLLLNDKKYTIHTFTSAFTLGARRLRSKLQNLTEPRSLAYLLILYIAFELLYIYYRNIPYT